MTEVKGKIEVPCQEAVMLYKAQLFCKVGGGHGGRVVTFSPPTSEARVWFTSLPQVGKLVVACHWSAVYSTEP